MALPVAPHRHDDRRGRHEASALTRLAQITRVQFRLEPQIPVRVEELVTTEPGFPPLETRITFWTGNHSCHQYRIFEKAALVSARDLPPWWYRDALIIDDYPSCDCCG